jgi:hypothetical protein
MAADVPFHEPDATELDDAEFGMIERTFSDAKVGCGGCA